MAEGDGLTAALRELRANVAEVGRALVLAPAAAEPDRYHRFAEAVVRAAGDSRL